MSNWFVSTIWGGSAPTAAAAPAPQPEPEPEGVPETKMELQEEQAAPPVEEELRDAKDVDLLVDLGGRFLRSALHLGAGEFQPLEMQRMEFVLERTNLWQFINHCMQSTVLEALQDLSSKWDPREPEQLEQLVKGNRDLDHFWAQLRQMIRPCIRGFDRTAPRFASLKTPMLAQGQTFHAISSLLSHCPDLHRIVDVKPIQFNSDKQDCLAFVSLFKLLELAKSSFKLELEIPAELRPIYLPFPMFVGNFVAAVLERPLREHHFNASSNFRKVLISAPDKRSPVADAEYRFMLKWVFRSAGSCQLVSETQAGAIGCRREGGETSTILDIGSTNFKLTASQTRTMPGGARGPNTTLIDSFHMVQRDDACLRLVDPDMVGEISHNVFRRLHENVAFALIKRAKLVTYYVEDHPNTQFQNVANLLVGGDVVVLKVPPQEKSYRLLSKLADQSWLAEDCINNQLTKITADKRVLKVTPRRDGTDSTMPFHVIESVMLQLVEVGEHIRVMNVDRELSEQYRDYARIDRDRFIRSVDDLQDDYATFREISTLTEMTLVYGSQGPRSGDKAIDEAELEIITSLLSGLDELAPVPTEEFIDFARGLLSDREVLDNIITIVGRCAGADQRVGLHMLDQSRILAAVKGELENCEMIERIATRGFQTPVQAVLRQAMAAYLVLLAKAVVDLRYSRSLAHERDPHSPQHKIYLLGAINTGDAFYNIVTRVIKQHVGEDVAVVQPSSTAIIDGMKSFVDERVTGSQTLSDIWHSYVGTLRLRCEVVTAEGKKLSGVQVTEYQYHTREQDGNSTTSEADTLPPVVHATSSTSVSRSYCVTAFSLVQEHDDGSILEIPIGRAQFPLPVNWSDAASHQYKSVGPNLYARGASSTTRCWILNKDELGDRGRVGTSPYATVDLLQVGHLHLGGVLPALTPDTTGFHKSMPVELSDPSVGGTERDLASHLRPTNFGRAGFPSDDDIFDRNGDCVEPVVKLLDGDDEGTVLRQWVSDGRRGGNPSKKEERRVLFCYLWQTRKRGYDDDDDEGLWKAVVTMLEQQYGVSRETREAKQIVESCKHNAKRTDDDSSTTPSHAKRKSDSSSGSQSDKKQRGM